MGVNTKIEWATDTFNPWWGCVEVSPACDNCYARCIAAMYGHDVWGKDAERRLLSQKHWSSPIKWNTLAERAGERRRVFCGSMCDVMEDRDDLNLLRQRLFSLIDGTPWLDWLLLTKRPQNFNRFFPKSWLDEPRSNVWALTTVENQKTTWRIKELQQVRAAVRGLSCEPLLEAVDLVAAGAFNGPSMDWVICGGESGHKARSMNPQWPRGVRDQCLEAGVAFFFKQWGEFGLTTIEGTDQMMRVGRRSAGRELDGREWNDLPKAREFQIK